MVDFWAEQIAAGQSGYGLHSWDLLMEQAATSLIHVEL